MDLNLISPSYRELSSSVQNISSFNSKSYSKSNSLKNISIITELLEPGQNETNPLTGKDFEI